MYNGNNGVALRLLRNVCAKRPESFRKFTIVRQLRGSVAVVVVLPII